MKADIKTVKRGLAKPEVGDITLYQGTRHSLAIQAVNRDVPLDRIQKFLSHESPKNDRETGGRFYEPVWFIELFAVSCIFT